ncbi:MAG: hypothetical protein KatS3mg007_2117 [Thermoanaerobaculum sp.]|nr:MAG: hypothetical protein KatS3mg007_2117 [Thermoanaerobaculum sp.]
MSGCFTSSLCKARRLSLAWLLVLGSSVVSWGEQNRNWWVGEPTLPGYGKCSSHKPVGLKKVPMFVSCVDVFSDWFITCKFELKLRYAEEPFPLVNGGHLHNQKRNDAGPNVIGGMWLPFAGGDVQPLQEIRGEVFGDAEGVFFVPEVSGAVWLDVRVDYPFPYRCASNVWWDVDPNDDSVCVASFQLIFAVAGLAPMPRTTFYGFAINPTEHYPEPFFGTPSMLAELSSFALDYYVRSPEYCGKAEKLSFNDFSQPFGGLYDFKRTWDCPHSWHRVGESADINTTHTDGSLAVQELIDLLDAKRTYIERNTNERPLIHLQWAGPEARRQ